MKKIKAIGLTNQRETTVVWNKNTGKPLHNAIVWLDTRTASTCSHLVSKLNNNRDYFRETCGLPLAPYFSATKLKWMLDEVPEVRNATEKGECMFGTVDSWLIWVSLFIHFSFPKSISLYNFVRSRYFPYLMLLNDRFVFPTIRFCMN